MIARFFDQLRHETRFVFLISRRGLVKRLVVMSMMLAICLYAGKLAEVRVVAQLVVLAEALALVLQRLQPGEDADAGPRLAAAMWGVNVGSTLIYLLPSMLLAEQDSVPLLLVGVIWLFGIYVHISNSFVALPVHNWSQMLPAFAMAIVVFACTPGISFESRSPMYEWAMPAMLMLIYGSHTFESLTLQKDTQRALDDARAEANARLLTLEHMTRHDGLTGLLTRRAFDEGLAKLLERRRDGREVAVMLFDLDGFKPINDTYSHDAGDRVLVVIAERLARLVGGESLAGRLGGDEFVLAVSGLDSAATGMKLAHAALREIESPIDYEERELRVGASVGIALTGRCDDDSVPGLCAAADQAMYDAKDRGANKVVLYDPAAFAPRPSADDRLALTRALDDGAIRPHYQPVVRLDTGETCGFEALPVWHHPTRGVLGSDQFMPLLSELGLQGDFMNRMARRVLADLSLLLVEGFDPGRVSVDLSEVALATQSGCAELERALAIHPDAAGHLTLEISEAVFDGRSGGLIRASLLQLRRAAMRMSLDGFGTGFASFQQLRQLDFEELKIAPAIIAGLGTDRAAEVLIGGVLGIARGLEVAAVAEGIENEDQLAHLRRMGCVYGQGDLFGGAEPLDAVRCRLFSEQPPRQAAAGA